jgi:Tfp pilus assembly protein PilF
MLNDPVRSVRIEAARVLASIPSGALPKEQQAILDKGFQEYINAQLSNAERPEAQTNLGSMYVALGKFDKALIAFNTAIEINPVFVPAYINLADAYRVQNNEVKVEKTLRRALKSVPDSSVAHHALGLSLVRQKRNKEAVEELRLAATLNPDNTRYMYIYAVALNSTGNPEQAILILQGANTKHPNNVEILSALVSFHRDLGNKAAAQSYAKKLQAISP